MRNSLLSLRLYGALLIAALLTLLLIISVPGRGVTRHTEARNTELDSLRARIERLQDAAREFAETYERDIAPIEHALLRYRTGDTMLVRRIATSIVRHARENRLDPHLLTGVLLVENPWLKPDTASFVGALGLMQVMPLHAGSWGCDSSDLVDVDTNICHGARILAWNVARTGDLDRALLRYNGCVRGTNTPDCHTYPDKVYRLVAHVRHQMVAAASAG